MSDSSLEVCRMWKSLTSAGDSFRTAMLSTLFPCAACADACADASSAGLGGFVRLPDGRQGCFCAKFSADALHGMLEWIPSDSSPQHFIATWELLAQVAVLYCLKRLLPVGHLPLSMWFSERTTPATLGFQDSEIISVPWATFPTSASLSHFPEDSPMPQFLTPGG